MAPGSQEAYRALMELERLNRRLIANAHDLNNALSVIIGNTDILQMNLPPGHSAKDSLDAISKASRRAADLVRQIQTCSRSSQEFQLLQLKPVVKDTGIRLSVAHGSGEGREGAIGVDNQPDHGPSFHHHLPVCQSVPAKDARVVKVPFGRGERILFVDDEEWLRQAAKPMAERLAMEVVVAADGNDGLTAFRAGPDRYRLVVTDLGMPGMDGLQLARRLLEIRPDVPIILATGYGGETNVDLVRGLGIRELLPKPFSFDQLAQAVHRALEHRQAG